MCTCHSGRHTSRAPASMRMRYGLLSALILLNGVIAMNESRAAAPAVTNYGQRNPAAPPELDAFAFLVGKWDGAGKTKLPDGKSAEFAVSWIGRYVLDGMAIADEFHSSAPDGSPYLGISLRQYDPARKSWIIEYLNVSNSFLRRQVNPMSGSVKVDGQVVAVTSESPEVWTRETYRPVPPNRFTYSLDVSSDGGRNWVVGQIEIEFVRKE